jgi:hypothetical protein
MLCLAEIRWPSMDVPDLEQLKHEIANLKLSGTAARLRDSATRVAENKKPCAKGRQPGIWKAKRDITVSRSAV